MLAKLIFLMVLSFPVLTSAQYYSPNVKPMQLTEYEWQRYQQLQFANLGYGGPVAQMFIGAAVTAGSAFTALHYECVPPDICSTVWVGSAIGLVISLAAIPRLRARSRARRELRWLEQKATVDFVQGPRLYYKFRF